MGLIRTIIATFFFTFFFVQAAAQDSSMMDSLENKFSSRFYSFQQTQVYLHLDKSVYVNNENIWFKAYILKSATDLAKQQTLHVFLSDRLTHTIIASEKFVIEEGLSAGALFIPDSIRAGDYNLVAYTNTLPEEKDPFVFQQLVSIRKPQSQEDAYTFSFENALFTSMADSVSFVCRIVNTKSLYAKDADVVYKILANDKVIATGKNKINQYGELPVSFLPVKNADKFELEALVVKGKDSFLTRQSLPFLENKISLRWFPESGDLVENISGKIVFEAMALTGKPAVIKGQLLEDGIAVANINTNITGLGVITIKPSASKKYSLQLQDAKSQSVVLNFPAVKKNGYTISVEQGVVGDTIFATINKSGNGNNVHLLMHNYEEIFGFTDLLINGDKLLVKIPASEIKAGLVTLTLLDAAGQPCAERTIFKGYHQLPIITVEADSLQYHKRSKVNLKIQAKDEKGNPLAGVYSLACVLAKRIDTTSYQDIMPYHFFNNYIQHGLIPKSSLYGMADKETLELFLLSRCWTRYKEPAVDTAVAAVAKNKNLTVAGYVLYKGKKVNKPVKLILLGKTGIEEVMTNEQGVFAIPDSALAMEAGQKANFFVSEKNQLDYQIIFYRDMDSLEKKLAAQIYPLASQIKAVLPEEEKEALNKIKTLTAVVVKSKSEKDAWGTFRSKDCNDYVCMNNILNCTNHRFGGTKPVDGESYHYLGKMVVYRGCAAEKKDIFVKLKGRYYSKEFYKADYEKFNAPDLEIYSTVYWLPEIVTDKNGEGTISFYTNDLPGIFSITIEGITEKGVVNGRKLLKVLP